MLKSILGMTTMYSNGEQPGGDYQSQLQVEMGKASLKCARRFDENTMLVSRPIPSLHNEIVAVGGLLGKGGFNEVREIRVKKSNEAAEEILAMKHLRDSVMKTRSEFFAGAVDLVTEAKLLNALNHKNIVGLHGSSCPDDELPNVYLNGGRYCIYLDRLYGTVDEAFTSWRSELTAKKKKQELHNRIKTIALPVAEALAYLHNHQIIFRDIKPSNIGFAADGTVKLFDFGLAREMRPSHRKLTGATGSRRYMAPEVALSINYGLPADVYSYGIFLYETCTLLKPYDGMTRSEHITNVVYGVTRPKFDHTCETPVLQKLIKKCWARTPRSRPLFHKIVETLQEELKKVDDETNSRQKMYGFFRWSGSKTRSMQDDSRIQLRQGACAA